MQHYAQYHEEDLFKAVFLSAAEADSKLQIECLLTGIEPGKNKKYLRAVTALLEKKQYHHLVSELFKKIDAISQADLVNLLKVAAKKNNEEAVLTLLSKISPDETQSKFSTISDLDLIILFNISIENSLPNLLSWILANHANPQDLLLYANLSKLSRPDILKILIENQKLDFSVYLNPLTAHKLETLSEELLIQIIKKYSQLFNSLIKANNYLLPDDQLEPVGLLNYLIFLDKHLLVAFLLAQMEKSNNNNQSLDCQFDLIQSDKMYTLLTQYGLAKPTIQAIVNNCQNVLENAFSTIPLYIQEHASSLKTKVNSNNLNLKFYEKFKNNFSFLEHLLSNSTADYGQLIFEPFSDNLEKNVFEQLLILAAKEKLTHVLKFLYLPNKTIISPETNKQILLTLMQTNNYDLFLAALTLLDKQVEKDTIIEITKFCLTGFNSHFLDVLLNKYAEIVLLDPSVTQLASKVRTPKIAYSLIKNGFKYSKSSLKELKTTAYYNRMVNSCNYLMHH